MGDYGRTTGTGGPGSGAITNDDDYTLDLPEIVDDSAFDYSETKDERSY